MSRSGVEVRQDITASVLRKKARAEKDVLAASRMLGIVDACCAAWKVLIDEAGRIQSIASRPWIQSVSS